MPSTTPSDTASTPSTTSHRKAPQCSKCKRPRKGHPRSGCPFVNSPSNEKGPAPKAMEGLTIASESVISGSDSSEETTVIKNRRRSTQPEVAVPAAASRTAVWQETIRATPVAPDKATRSKIQLRSPMPRSSIPPTSDSFISSNTSTAKSEIISANLPEQNSASSVSSSVSSSTRRTQPLSRPMGAVERDTFITKLSYESSATIYIVPKADVEAIVAQATTLKFTTHTIMNDDDENDPQVLLILARTGAALQALLHKVENGNDMAQLNKKRSPRNCHRGPSTFKTAAGAAVIGFVDLLRPKKIYARPIN